MRGTCERGEWCKPVFIRANNGNEDFAGIALLDTGATHSLIPESLVRELALPVVGVREVQTASGYIAMPVVYAEVKVGEADFVGAQMLVTPTTDLVAVGRDLIQRLGILEMSGLN